MSRTPGNQFSPTLYRTSNTNGSWNWSTVRNVNYQLNVIKNKYEAKKLAEMMQIFANILENCISSVHMRILNY